MSTAADTASAAGEENAQRKSSRLRGKPRLDGESVSSSWASLLCIYQFSKLLSDEGTVTENIAFYIISITHYCR